jgi:hypothetical protein
MHSISVRKLRKRIEVWQMLLGERAARAHKRRVGFACFFANPTKNAYLVGLVEREA